MNKKTKIAFLIPITSKGRNWKKVEDTYFNQIFIRSLIGTINSKFIYKVYLVIDSDDNLFFNSPTDNEYKPEDFDISHERLAVP